MAEYYFKSSEKKIAHGGLNSQSLVLKHPAANVNLLPISISEESNQKIFQWVSLRNECFKIFIRRIVYLIQQNFLTYPLQ